MDLRIDTTVLLHKLVRHVIKLIFILVIDGWEKEGTKPSKDEKRKGVEDGANEGYNIQEDGKLECLNVVLKQDEAFGLQGEVVNILRCRADKRLDFLGGKSNLDISHEVQGVTARLLKESHEMNINTGSHTQHQHC